MDEPAAPVDQLRAALTALSTPATLNKALATIAQHNGQSGGESPTSLPIRDECHRNEDLPSSTTYWVE